MQQWIKLALEAGPLLVFFIGNAKFGIVPATLAFVTATVVALVLSWILSRKMPAMPLIGGVFVIVFGGLTVLLEDDLFIKIKPTLVNALFAGLLIFSLLSGRNYLKLALGTAFSLTVQGWRILAWRWAIFFVCLAVLNELAWRTLSTDMWVNFKVFGIMPLTLLFGLCQVPLLMRHGENEDKAEEKNAPDQQN